MQLLKFNSLILLFALFSKGHAFVPFTDNHCLEGNFSTKVIHKGFPLGLTETKIEIEKKDCNLIIRHEKLKFIKKQWDIDVCRGPIHIKYGVGTVEVVKKSGACKSLDSDYCKMSDELFKIFQDDGLIFAQGEKEDLSSAHGRVNCSYLLSKAYLEGSNVFGRQEQYEGMLKKYANSWESIEAVSPNCVVAEKPKSETSNANASSNAVIPTEVVTPLASPTATALPGKVDF